MRHFVAGLFLFSAISTAAIADDSNYKADFACASKLQAALKRNDKDAVAEMITYPQERDYPLSPIKSAEEFVKNWDEFFDSENIQVLTKDKPEQFGIHEVQLMHGEIQFKDGMVYKIFLHTKAYDKDFAKARSEEAAGVNRLAQDYKRVAVQCETGTKVIRIQEHDDGFHYFVWKKGDSLSSKPELNLTGAYVPDGNGGNGHYTFNNHNYSYVLDDVVLCEDPVCHKTLIVTKNGKEISNQPCN